MIIIVLHLESVTSKITKLMFIYYEYMQNIIYIFIMYIDQIK